MTREIIMTMDLYDSKTGHRVEIKKMGHYDTCYDDRCPKCGGGIHKDPKRCPRYEPPKKPREKTLKELMEEQWRDKPIVSTSCKTRWTHMYNSIQGAMGEKIK